MGLLLNRCGEMKFKIDSSISKRVTGTSILVPILWKMSNEKISKIGFHWLIKISEDIQQLLLCWWKHLLLFKCKVEKKKQETKKIALTARHPLLPASQHFVNILTGGEKKEEKLLLNVVWAVYFLNIKRKETGWFVFWKLANMPGR